MPNDVVLDEAAGGGGQDLTFPYLSLWLRRKEHQFQKDGQLNAYLASGKHPVPQGDKELQASQNLFWLRAGAERAKEVRNIKNTDQQLIARLERERDSIGLWGSEQTSPIYHGFTLTGSATVAILTSNILLKNLIRENHASFFWYAIRMGLLGRPQGLVGQRGAGHNYDHGSPDLHFVLNYFMTGRPDQYHKMESWRNFLKNSGWAFAGIRQNAETGAVGRLYEWWKEVFELVVDPQFKPWPLRVRTDFFKRNDRYVATVMEAGINGNTPEVGAYVENGYLPRNYKVRVRQKQSRGKYTWELNRGTYGNLLVTYTGLYDTLEGHGSLPQSRSLSVGLNDRLFVLTSSLAGVTGWEELVSNAPGGPVTVVPDGTVAGKKDKPSWIERMGI